MPLPEITKIPDRYFSGGFFYNPETKQVLLHKRDNKTGDNPNLWAFFGGTSEEVDDHDPIQTFVREVDEELGIYLEPQSVIHLTDYYNPDFSIHRFVFYVINSTPKSEMHLTEGEGFDWVDLEQAFTMNISKRTREDLETFKALLANN